MEIPHALGRRYCVQAISPWLVGVAVPTVSLRSTSDPSG